MSSQRAVEALYRPRLGSQQALYRAWAAALLRLGWAPPQAWAASLLLGVLSKPQIPSKSLLNPHTSEYQAHRLLTGSQPASGLG